MSEEEGEVAGANVRTGTNMHVEGRHQERVNKRKRNESPAFDHSWRQRSYSRSPPRRRNGPSITDVDPQRRRERERQLRERMADEQAMQPMDKPVFDAKAEYERLMNTRAGGTYVPPARLRALQAAFQEKGTKEHQRMAWETLKKSINGLINKVNKSNIKEIAPALFRENLVRGRGLYARSIMRAQAASLPFTPIYAAITAIINTKLPQVGELLLSRLIVQLRKAFKRNDKAVCISSTTFIAHLCNHQVAHEIVALQILALLLERPTNDSVEIAVGFMREIGQYLAEVSPKANDGVFDRFRTTLHEASIDKRVQYMIEVLFQIRKEKFKDHPIVPEELDLVEEEDQITHYLSLDDSLDVQESLGVFHFDEEYEENEAKYNEIKKEILGEDEDDDDEEEEDAGSDVENATNGEDETALAQREENRKLEIQDETNTKLINLRRTIYLKIMSSSQAEECAHKLLKIRLEAGQERELCNMIIECCSQSQIYDKYHALVAERFCNLNRFWRENFEHCFMTYYDTIHRYEANKLRNIARLFGHLLSFDAITWQVLQCIHLNEEETTSSSRIFIKILFQEFVAILGLKAVLTRLGETDKQLEYSGLFPRDDAKNTRFSINYFTSIGLGALTESMREHLKNLPKPVVRAPSPDSDSGSDSGSYTSYSQSSRSYSTDSRSRSRSRSRSIDSIRSDGPRRSRRKRSYSSSYTSSSESRESTPDRGRQRKKMYSSDPRYQSKEPSRSRPPYRRFSSYSDRSESRSRSATPRRRRRYSNSDSRSSRSPTRTPERRRRSMTPVPSTTRVRQARKDITVRRPGRSLSRSSSRSLSRSRNRNRSRSPSHSPSRAQSQSPISRRN